MVIAELTREPTRRADWRSASDFLASAAVAPSALVIEGEAGIGKTTFWSMVLDRAGTAGFEVLSARPAAAESVLSYACLADLLAGVDPSVWSGLPYQQCHAIDQVLLRASVPESPTDRRLVSAAFLAVIDRLGEQAPIVLAIDDLQWLDPSSTQVLAFAARRLSGRIGLLAAVRADTDGAAASWVQLSAGSVTRIRLGPLAVGQLHAVVSQQLGRSFPRPTMVRICEVSGGNPFYAIELARNLSGHRPAQDIALPNTLSELVRARIGGLDQNVRNALLATACLGAPTVETVAEAVGMRADHLVELLEDVEDKGIIAISGNRLRFDHPLLARGVYTDASPAQRRTLHRRLAQVVDQPEVRARHLALAATSGDTTTLQALDTAARSARMRGAPAAAAELIELAIGLGGDTPERRLLCARDHFDAGDLERARAVLEQTIAQLAAGSLRAEALTALAVIRLYDEGYREAANLLQHALDEAGERIELRAPLLVALSWAQFNAGRLGEAVTSVDAAVACAERLGEPDCLNQALSMGVLMRFLYGDGFDQATMQRALQLAEARWSYTPMPFRPRVQAALLHAFTDQLHEARAQLQSIRCDAVASGDDADLGVVAFHRFLVECWLGNFAEAHLFAEDNVELAMQHRSGPTLVGAVTARAWLAAYSGEESTTRRLVAEALAASQRSGAFRVAQWAIRALGFLEVSLGNYEAALEVLEPSLLAVETEPNATEIVLASFLPDAVESLVQLGRVSDAEPLVEALERNGQRLDRAWMLAMAGRCRAMVLAARGDIVGASQAVGHAMEHHDRLTMPFERARTLLLQGQLQRRQRKRDTSATTIREALTMFEALNTPLWIDRARIELERSSLGRKRGTGLTPAEQRVAELAASGMTNRDVAAVLFISSKTVEANLARVYRKLGIRSRAELGQHLGADATGSRPRRVGQR